MRCSVCGKDDRFHVRAQFALQKKVRGTKKWDTLTTAFAPKCLLVQRWQSALLDGSLSGFEMRIQKVGTDAPCLCGAYGAHEDCGVR